jgi:DNA-binding LytR/AlgR family response regulator
MIERGLTILAADDERTQLEDLARMLRSSPLVDDVECAADGRVALVMASQRRYDAIFLDVRMPELDGVALARVLRRFATPPQLVFVSAYDTAAVDAFELQAVDYLRKPVSRRRLEDALDRVSAAAESGDGLSVNRRYAGGGGGVRDAAPAPGHGIAGGTDPDVIAVANPRGGAVRLIARDAILYAQAHGDYARIVTADGRYLVRATIGELEQRWAPHGFARVHRQHLANLHRAIEIRPQLGGTAELVFADGQAIPIARRKAGELRRHLGV